jgi:hypothetical protein
MFGDADLPTSRGLALVARFDRIRLTEVSVWRTKSRNNRTCRPPAEMGVVYTTSNPPHMILVTHTL